VNEAEIQRLRQEAEVNRLRAETNMLRQTLQAQQAQQTAGPPACLLQRLLKQCSAALYNFLMELLLALAALLVLLQSKYECFICYKQKGSRHRGVTGPTSHHPGTRP